MPPDPEQLRHLVRLLEDDTRMVRDSVLGALLEYGDGLEPALEQMPTPLERERVLELRGWLSEYRDKIERFGRGGAVGTVIGRALFDPGDLIAHRRYGYRGVVVDRDMTCRADEAWYQHNRTRPERDQPWYHVLVDGTDTATYAAQTSLIADTSTAPVSHALLWHFFDDVVDGHYIRNGLEWPRA